MAVYHPWIRSFVRWFKRVLGKSDNRRTILEEYYADNCSAVRLADPTIPGCLHYWHINHHETGATFVILLLDRKSINGFRLDSRTRLEPHQRRIANELETQIEDQAHIDATHYWITGWLKTVVRTRDGKTYRDRDIVDLKLLACDLSGYSGVFNGDRFADRIPRKIAFRLATHIDSRQQPLRHASWEEVVRKIDWAGWLTAYAQSRAGIAPGHILQPIKPNRSAVNQKHRLNN